MDARIALILATAGTVTALLMAVFIVPRLERLESEMKEKAKKDRWTIISREFIDFGKEEGRK